MFYILIIFSLFGNIYAGDSGKPFLSKKEPSHILIFKKKFEGKPILLLKEPREDSTILEKISIDDSRYSNADIFEKFDNKKTSTPGAETAAVEEKNNYYKVSYNGKAYWVHSKNFSKIYSMEDYFEEYSIQQKILINYKKAMIFDKKKNRISLSELQYKIPRKNGGGNNHIFTLKEYKEIDGSIWLFGNLCGPFGNDYFDKPCDDFVKDIWVKPFNENGEIVGVARFIPKGS